MNMDVYEKAVEMGLNRQHLFIATYDPLGWPHMASVGCFEVMSEGRVALSDWTCPLTARNLQHNRRVSLLIWDIATDVGYQLLGEVEAVSALDGTRHSGDGKLHLGHPEEELVVRIEKALTFSHAPHSDVESGEEASPGYLVDSDPRQVNFLGPAKRFMAKQEAQR